MTSVHLVIISAVISTTNSNKESAKQPTFITCLSLSRCNENLNPTSLAHAGAPCLDLYAAVHTIILMPKIRSDRRSLCLLTNVLQNTAWYFDDGEAVPTLAPLAC